MEDLNKVLYERLKNELDKKGVNKTDLADYLGITSSGLSQKLYNSKFIDMNFLHKVKSFCNEIDLEYVLTGNSNNSLKEEYDLSYEEKINRMEGIIEYLENKVNQYEDKYGKLKKHRWANRLAG